MQKSAIIILALALLSACGPAHMTMPASRQAPVGSGVTPFVFQSGQPPTDWVAFPLASGVSPGESLIAGPDGAMWFTAEVPAAIDRITMDGAVTSYPLASGVIRL